MDARFLSIYNRELLHLREMGGEFARDYPKVAGRLSLDGFTCGDPYVERLLEGFAFLTSRVQLKLEAEFPRFTNSLLQAVYPQYLCPTPAMCVVQLEPELTDQALLSGHVVERGAVLHGPTLRDQRTPVEFRTAHEMRVWPLRVAEASYVVQRLGTLNLPAGLDGVKAAIRVRLELTPGATFDKLVGLESLTFHLRAATTLQHRLYEAIFGHCKGVLLQAPTRPTPWRARLAADSIRPRGFEDPDAILPVSPRSYGGYRLLQEAFALPERFFFFDVANLAALRALKTGVVDLLLLLDTADPELDESVDAAHFALNCSPAVNLFPKRPDRIHVSDRFNEFHVVPDRTRPRDFEVYDVQSIEGIGESAQVVTRFRPFYEARDSDAPAEQAYFEIARVPRTPSQKDVQQGARSKYGGSDLYVSLVDARSAPYSGLVKQLAIQTMCTNRDLSLLMPADSTLSFDSPGPVQSARIVSGTPSRPRPSMAEHEQAWRVISHLSQNYLSLGDAAGEADGVAAAAALRGLLRLYADTADAAVRRQVDGVRSVRSDSITRRIQGRGPIAFGRGLRVTLDLEDAAFEGASAFLMAAILERFFAGYVSINSFTETVLRTMERGEVMTWSTRPGQRPLL